jgi:hypothetical protein
LYSAFGKLSPDDEVRNVIASTNYLRYPSIGYRKWKSTGEFRAAAKDAYDWSDVNIYTNTLELYHQLDDGQKKPAVMIHRGTRYRNNPKPVYEEGARIGARQLVSTVDLLLAYPEGDLEWLPQFTDIEAMAAYVPKRRRRSKTIRIAHSPTDRVIKGTDYVIRAVQRLSEHYDVELDLIEGVTWEQALTRKATADIFIDQMELGYGNAATEAWAMGIPVIAGATPDILKKMRETYNNKTLPFVSARPRTLYGVLEKLVKSKTAREDAADIGMMHLKRFHSIDVAVPYTRNVLRSTGPSAGGMTKAEALDEYSVRKAAGRYIPLRIKRQQELSL